MFVYAVVPFWLPKWKFNCFWPHVYRQEQTLRLPGLKRNVCVNVLNKILTLSRKGLGVQQSVWKKGWEAVLKTRRFLALSSVSRRKAHFHNARTSCPSCDVCYSMNLWAWHDWKVSQPWCGVNILHDGSAAVCVNRDPPGVVEGGGGEWWMMQNVKEA